MRYRQLDIDTGLGVIHNCKKGGRLCTHNILGGTFILVLNYSPKRQTNGTYSVSSFAADQV